MLTLENDKHRLVIDPFAVVGYSWDKENGYLIIAVGSAQFSLMSADLIEQFFAAMERRPPVEIPQPEWLGSVAFAGGPDPGEDEGDNGNKN